MAKRVFYVVYFGDRDVQRILDAIRFLCNPTEKGLAHITVRGPYKRYLAYNHVDTKTRIIEGTIISVDGLGTFFDHDQNTIVLKCSSEALRRVWKKQDYGYNPHITLYDGDSRQIAKDIVNRLTPIDLRFSCQADGISPHVSHKRQPIFDLRSAFDAEFVSQFAQRRVDANLVDNMEWHERLTLVGVLAERLSQPATGDNVPNKTCLTER